jgi:2-oxoacid:acceptor oxidoreductase gamma subunit (pyruvate/2-ketoisovalerate family)/2-oxoacid:acceptor oxidoreductase delta subunit (pyruvate/2-ketoisovalerate family)
MQMEIRLHGRGGQGGVTCAKIVAAVHARLGKSVQTFGDYASERTGAPVRAYTRVSDQHITNRNKVYRPDHVLVLDNTLLGDDVVAGLRPGGTLIIDSPQPPSAFAGRFGAFRIATVDATGIARRRGIGSRSLVIVNTTIAGAYARAFDVSLDVLEQTYRELGFISNFDAAREAYESTQLGAPTIGSAAAPGNGAGASPDVLALTTHHDSAPTHLKTGSWRVLTPHYVENLAPCSMFCPAGNDVIGFVQAAARGDTAEASTALGRTSALAATCGRVCPAPCMAGCNRVEYDGAVNIRGLERWIADEVPVASKERKACAMPRRFAVLGGGPAGLSAAYELAREGHSVTLFDAEPELGGVLRTGIPTYRLPRDVLDREVAGILALGVQARCGHKLAAQELAAMAGNFDAVVLATGLQRLRGLELPGIALDGVEQGIDFLHRVNLGGGARLKGHVVVLGGGNTAMDCARSALRSGAERVTIAYRRSDKEMPAIAEEVHEAVEEGVRMLFLRQPVAFLGNGTVAAVELAEVDLGEPDQSGRRAPVVSSRIERLDCDAVLLALGQSADASVLPPGWALDDGRVVTAAGALNVFAAGDFSTGDGTVTHAIGDGRRAASRAMQALGLEVTVFERPDRNKAVPATDMRFDHFARAAATVAPCRPAEERIRDFQEVRAALPDALEAHRCFSCGHCTQCDTCLVYCPEGIVRRKNGGYDVDYTYCKGCGICAVECPRKALEMVEPCQSN